jgi:predicted nucleotidyltransferase
MPAVVALLGLEDELRARMAEHVARWRLPPASLVIYGSVARGETTAGSDLDLLVVRPDTTEPDDATWEAEVADLADLVHRWTGWRASAIDMSRREAVEGLADGEPFLVEADRDGWLIAGQALHELPGQRT